MNFESNVKKILACGESWNLESDGKAWGDDRKLLDLPEDMFVYTPRGKSENAIFSTHSMAKYKAFLLKKSRFFEHFMDIN